MAHKRDEADVEQAWARFSSGAQDRPMHPSWENEEWVKEGIKENEVGEPLKQPGNILPLKTKSAPKPASKRRWPMISGWVAAVVLAAVLVVGPWGGNIMAAMLKTFTVQSIQGVPVSQNEIAKVRKAFETATPNGTTLNLKEYGEIKKFGGGPEQRMTLKAAEAKMKDNLLTFPDQKSANQVVSYEPGMRIHLKLHVQKVNQLLTALGGTTLLPESLEGKTARIDLPSIVTVGQKGHPEVTLTQARVPQIDVPSDVNVNKVKQAVLGLPIIPDSIRNRMKGTMDWKKTLYVPLMNQKDHETVILGHQAVVYTGQNRSHQGERMVIWLDNEHIYMLRGTVDQFPTEQDLIQEVKEIIQYGARH